MPKQVKKDPGKAKGKQSDKPRQKDLDVKDEKAGKVKGGAFRSFSDVRLKRDVGSI